MLSLAYRIATMGIIFPSDEVIHDPSAQAVIAETTKIRLDNVRNYSLNKKDSAIDLQDDIPNWAPPLANLFFEWNEPLTGDSWMQCGCHVSATDFSEHKDVRESLLARMVSSHNRDAGWGPASESQQRMIDAVSGARWGLSATFWGSSNKSVLIGLDSFYPGRPIRYPPWALIFVGGDGRCLNYYLVGKFGFESRHSLATQLSVVGLGISFMHCKNVRQIEEAEDPGERFRHQYKVPKFRYRTLIIDPMKEVLRTEGGIETNGIKKALHICRGHFATYSEDKPLFGKYAGTFFKPDHVRGKIEHGAVVKDYDVKSPN